MSYQTFSQTMPNPFCTASKFSSTIGNVSNLTRVEVASSISQALQSSLQYDVQMGNYSFFFLKDCATYDLDNCFALNADSPYGMTFLPDPPTQQEEYKGCVTATDVCGLGCNPSNDPELDVKICNQEQETMKWLLGNDDAVIILMDSPPECKYWSMTYYQMSKYYRNEAELRSESPAAWFESELQEKASNCPDPPARCQTFASLGSPINYLDLKDSNGGSGFEEPMVIIMTASKAAEQNVKLALDQICTDVPVFSARLPSDLLTLGSSDESDVMTMLLRTAFPTNATAMSEYFVDAPVSVLRATTAMGVQEDSNSLCDAHYCASDVVFKKRGNGEMESGGDELTSEELIKGLEDLGIAIDQVHGTAQQTTKFLRPYFDTGLDCLQGGIMCEGDCPDTLYPVSENVYQAEFCNAVGTILLPLGCVGAVIAGALGFLLYGLIFREKKLHKPCFAMPGSVVFCPKTFWGKGCIAFFACFAIVFVPVLIVYLTRVQCSHYATIDSGPSDFYIVYGINHKATGHATYSSINAYYYERLAGVAAASSETTPGFNGSAQVYLGQEHPAAKYLYAYHFSRNCLESNLIPEYCLDIPSSGEVSLPPGGHIMFIGRMYIDPQTGAGPAANETIYDMLKHYY